MLRLFAFSTMQQVGATAYCIRKTCGDVLKATLVVTLKKNAVVPTPPGEKPML
jgi:hypothetical protein